MILQLIVAASLAAGLIANVAHAQVSDDVVRIGISDDMSGPFADSGGLGSLIAARMAVDDFKGQVLGKQVEIVSADHQNKSDVGSNLARKWFDTDKVDMITGLGNSSVAIATQQLAREKARITIVTNAGSSDLTGKFCSPFGFHWVYDTYALSNVVGRAAVRQGRSSWYFVTADYSFGYALERDAIRFVSAEGGKVIGSVKFPVGSTDFASFLLQAQGSKASAVALAAAGADFTNLVKQAGEFGLRQKGQSLIGLLVYISDVHSIGLELAQGLVLGSAFYWDANEESRAFAKRFFAQRNAMPTMIQAGVYSAVTHYLNAVRVAGTDEGSAVAAKMRELPINDFMTRNGRAREDGRVIRDMYLFEVKRPSESKGPWDYYRQLAAIPADEAFRSLSEGECPLVRR